VKLVLPSLPQPEPFERDAAEEATFLPPAPPPLCFPERAERGPLPEQAEPEAAELKSLLVGIVKFRCLGELRKQPSISCRVGGLRKQLAISSETKCFSCSFKHGAARSAQWNWLRSFISRIDEDG